VTVICCGQDFRTSGTESHGTKSISCGYGGIRALPMGNNVWQVYSYNSRMRVQRIEDAVNNDPSQVLFDQPIARPRM
jgi:hypothetical protein